MSHKLANLSVHFDELIPEMTVSMRKATYEHLTHQKLVDPTLAVKGEPGSIPRKGGPVAAIEAVAGPIETEAIPPPEPQVVAEEPEESEELHEDN